MIWAKPGDVEFIITLILSIIILVSGFRVLSYIKDYYYYTRTELGKVVVCLCDVTLYVPVFSIISFIGSLFYIILLNT